MEFKTLELAGFNTSIMGIIKQAEEASHEVTNSRIGDDGNLRLCNADLQLLQQLIACGPGCSEFLDDIHIWVEAKAPIYWWCHALNTSYHTLRQHTPLLNDVVAKMTAMDKDPAFKAWVESGGGLDNVPESVSCCCEVNPYTVVEGGLAKVLEASITFLNQPARGELTFAEICSKMQSLIPSAWLVTRTRTVSYGMLRKILKTASTSIKLDYIEPFIDWIGSLPYGRELILHKMWNFEYPSRPVL